MTVLQNSSLTGDRTVIKDSQAGSIVVLSVDIIHYVGSKMFLL